MAGAGQPASDYTQQVRLAARTLGCGSVLSCFKRVIARPRRRLWNCTDGASPPPLRLALCSWPSITSSKAMTLPQRSSGRSTTHSNSTRSSSGSSSQGRRPGVRTPSRRCRRAHRLRGCLTKAPQGSSSGRPRSTTSRLQHPPTAMAVIRRGGMVATQATRDTSRAMEAAQVMLSRDMGGSIHMAPTHRAVQLVQDQDQEQQQQFEE